MAFALKAKRVPREFESKAWFEDLAAIDATKPHDASEGMAALRSPNNAPRCPVAAESNAALFLACKDAPEETKTLSKSTHSQVSDAHEFYLDRILELLP